MEEKLVTPSKTTIIKMIISFLVIICVICILASYLINDEFRNMVDTKILKKEITENTSYNIEINSDMNPYIGTYDKYITVFSKNVLTLYNHEANVVSKIDANLTTPYMVSNQKYLALAEQNGQKLYFISEANIKWEKEMDGQIYRMSINKNGYVSVVLKNAINRSVIVVYNVEGKELFRVYLAANHYAVCAEISDNNKYLSIGQIDYSGVAIKSIVQIMSIDLAIENKENYTLNTYESESGKILSNMKFNSKNEIICMFDSYIQKITDLSDERLYDINNNHIFVDINLGDSIIIVEKESSGLFSYQYQMNIKSTIGKSDKLYILENGVPKELKVNQNLICMKLLGEVRIITSNGWLLKRYKNNSEIQNILLGDSIAGIVYHNKIEVIGL